MNEYVFRVSHPDSAMMERVSVTGTLATARSVYDDLQSSGYAMHDPRP